MLRETRSQRYEIRAQNFKAEEMRVDVTTLSNVIGGRAWIFRAEN